MQYLSIASVLRPVHSSQTNSDAAAGQGDWPELQRPSYVTKPGCYGKKSYLNSAIYQRVFA